MLTSTMAANTCPLTAAVGVLHGDCSCRPWLTGAELVVVVRGHVLLHACAGDETVILLHHPLPLAGVSIVMERERQQNGSLVRGYPHPPRCWHR